MKIYIHTYTSNRLPKNQKLTLDSLTYTAVFLHMNFSKLLEYVEYYYPYTITLKVEIKAEDALRIVAYFFNVLKTHPIFAVPYPMLFKY